MYIVGIYLQERVDGAHENAHRRETLRLSHLPQLLLSVRTPPVPQEDAYRHALLRSLLFFSNLSVGGSVAEWLVC